MARALCWLDNGPTADIFAAAERDWMDDAMRAASCEKQGLTVHL